MIMQFMTCSPMPPRPTAVAPYSPAATALLYSVPQKSAVNTPALNMNRANRMKMPMEATLHTMTMAFKNDALSTPRITSSVSSHMTTEAMRMQGTVFPGRKSG